MGEARYTIGIDLGTSNCAVAFAKLGGGNTRVEDFGVLQLSRRGEAIEGALFPSTLYAPMEAERAGGALDLPWVKAGEFVAGQFARWRGAKVPGRVITSAKSWLSHPSVDRTAAILPWGGAADVTKISPVSASAFLLQQMREAWNYKHPEARLEDQEVSITVPASFDESARSLTVQAAREAGIEKFILLEEPQAAFYDFSHENERRLAEILKEVRLVLVIDIGGGTTDFTLVQVGDERREIEVKEILSPVLSQGERGKKEQAGIVLKRVAVGDHLILGGDNMDSALAHRVEQSLGGKKISAGQWIQLVQASREAKEKLLETGAPEELRVSILSEGSQLLGGTVSAKLTRGEVEEVILNGFFPEIDPRDLPKKSGRAALQEMGLPFASEPAITKHLAAFLKKHSRSGYEALGIEGKEGIPRPDAILLNGGVFNSERITLRLVEVVSSWWPERTEIPLLKHGSLDLSVARGAAAYGLVRHGFGRKISGGSAHAFYLGIAGSKQNDGEEKQQAVCLIPRGFEEGETVELKERIFKLQLGKPVQFPLFTSTADRLHEPGDLVEVSDDFDRLPPIQTYLKSNKLHGEKIPVYIRAKLTEIGTLELWCAASEGREQWRLEFETRGSGSAGESNVIQALHPNFEAARAAVAAVFGSKPGGDKSPKDAKQLWYQLERLLGAREHWNLATLRQLTTELLGGANKRRRSADHEKVYFQLLGYCLRPGFGEPLDGWRCEQAFKIFSERVEYHKEKPNWNEFWILWRRISGGLGAEPQAAIWDYLKPTLSARVSVNPPKNVTRHKGIQPEGLDEMLRCAASLEEVEPAEKEWLGEQISERLSGSRTGGGPWCWSLGRLGARVPLYGSAHKTVSVETVERWIERLLQAGVQKIDGAPFALAQMARKTGDRLRDISEGLRGRVVEGLRSGGASETWVEMVERNVELKGADESRVFGDSLPIGLQLVQRVEENR